MADNSESSSMDPWSAAIIGGASLLGSGISALSTKKPSSSTHLAKLNLKYGKLYDEWAAKNMPRYNREGMEAAGFNPILAITAGQSAHGMANTPGHGAYDASGGAGEQISSGVLAAVNAAYDTAQKKENISLTKQETKLKKAQTQLTNFQRKHPGNPLQAVGTGSAKQFLENVGQWIGDKIGKAEMKWKDLKSNWNSNRNSSSAKGNFNNQIHIHFSSVDPGFSGFGSFPMINNGDFAK